MIKDYITNEPIFDGPYDARTRVHEYGGGQSFAYNGSVYFSNYLDDMLYVVKPGDKMPVRLTSEQKKASSFITFILWSGNETQVYIEPTGPKRRYADFDVHPVHPRIIVCVAEIHGKTVEDLIVAIDTETGQESAIVFASSHGEHPFLSRRPDFVDNPRFSPDGRHLVFRVW